MTNSNTQPHLGRRRCASGRTDRGSAIILVLVSMVLMAILAGSLLQLTRFERIPRSESNIEVVVESVINEILNQATSDLLDDAGNYLNAGNVANGGGDEPWDLPYTRPDRTLGRTADYFNGTSIVNTTVYGSQMDDSWLASHMPDFRLEATLPAGSLYDGQSESSTLGVWRKITNLTGVYLGGTSGSSNLASRDVPAEYPINNAANDRRRDNDHRTDSALLVDADGDGIGDSRWEWAPLRQVGATQYVMAVRIIDLSARADMNVATGRFGTTSDSLARGDNPTELDGSFFVYNTAYDQRIAAGDSPAAADTVATNRANEWRSVLNFRLTGNSPPTFSPIGINDAMSYDSNNANPPAGTRRDYWTDGASRVSNSFNPNGETPGSGYDYSTSATNRSTFGLDDAWELLQGNGIANARSSTAKDLMPFFLRGNAGQEGNYASGTPPFATQRQFWELDPRKHMSPFTGSAISAKPTATAGQLRELKVDVNRAVETGNLTAISNAIMRATDGNLPALYAHLSSEQVLADQLTANIADYIDRDNRLTTVGASRIGFEALPFITEVYIQRPYEARSATAGTDPMTGDPVNNVVWGPVPGSTTGYAIEIGNPFGRYDGSTWHGRPVSLENIWLKVGSNAAIALTDPSFGGDPMPNELQAGEVVVIYLNSTGGNATLDDIAANLLSAASGPATIAAEVSAPGTLLIDDNRTVVSLHAEAQGSAGTALTWYYSGARVETAGALINESIPQGDGDFATVATDTTYIQTGYVGIGQGLNMMTVHTRPQSVNPRGFGDSVLTLTEPRRNRNNGTGVAELAQVTPAFSEEDKAGAPPKLTTVLDDQQIVWPDNERERMHWIGDILQIPMIGPNYTASSEFSRTMAQAFINADAGGFVTAGGIEALLLPYQATTPAVAAASVNSGALNYPQGLLVLEQLTTFSPASDGENGDGSSPAAPPGEDTVGTPNDAEVLVPGRININTASEDTLVRLLPFPDLTTRRAVAAAIIERRESLTQANPTGGTGYGMGANGIPGIAYTTALYEQIATLPNGTPAGYVNISSDTADSRDFGSTATRVDLNDHETTLGTFVSADNIIDDREEKIMLAKWLTEVAETRSDIFAAYIVVQGYPADNFTEGATESARLIVIFSRANVKTGGDKAVEIGRFTIN